MAEYQSSYTGTEIDAGIGKANTAVQPADLSSKQDTLVSGTNIKTINGTSVLGNGNLATGIDYSTSEQNTGLKWIDGKDVYQKTYNATGLNWTAGDHWIPLELNTTDYKIINIYGVLDTGSLILALSEKTKSITRIFTNSASSADYRNKINVNLTDTTVIGYSITILYTKTTSE